jgi:hypothetical protein
MDGRVLKVGVGKVPDDDLLARAPDHSHTASERECHSSKTPSKRYRGYFTLTATVPANCPETTPGSFWLRKDR